GSCSAHGRFRASKSRSSRASMTSRVEKTTTTRSNSRPPSDFPGGGPGGGPARPSIPPDEVHSSVTASDGTRLFLRTKPASLESSAAPTIVFCDGIVCDGFIWKYLWNDLSPEKTATLAHFHY